MLDHHVIGAEVPAVVGRIDEAGGDRPTDPRPLEDHWHAGLEQFGRIADVHDVGQDVGCTQGERHRSLAVHLDFQ